jgi:eukaryotic-like serine/threonine-protein kinase
MKALYPKRQLMHAGLRSALIEDEMLPAVHPHVGLPAPNQLAPPNGAVFSNYPRTTTLRWVPVANAATYSVELDCFQCCAANKWCTAVGQTWQIVTGLTATQYVFNWVGAQPGRWRVWAVGPRGRVGRKSRWSKFIYTV